MSHQPSMLEYLRILYRHQIAFYLVLIFSLTVAVYLSRSLPKVYEASTTLFPPARQDILSLTSFQDSPLRAPQLPIPIPIQQLGLLGILQSRTLAERVAQKIPQRTVGQLLAHSDFDVTDENFIEIRVRDRDPSMAARIANVYAESYNAFFQALSLPTAQKTRIFIEEQLQEARKELRRVEDRLLSFRETHETASFDQELSLLIEENAKLGSEIDRAEVKLRETERAIEEDRRHLSSQQRMHPVSELTARNPVLNELEIRLAQLEVELNGKRKEFTDNHPEVQALLAQIRKAQERIREESRTVRQQETTSLNAVYEELRKELVSQQVEREALQARLRGLREAKEEIDRKILRFPKIGIDIGRISRDIRHYEQIVNMLSLKLEEAKIQEAKEIQTFVIVDPAVVPAAPVFPNLMINLLVAGSFGLIGGIFYCFLLEYIGKVWRSSEMGGQKLRPEAASEPF